MSRGASAVAWTWGVILGLGALVALVIGGWQAGWWFANADANRSVQVQHNGINYQSTLHDRIAIVYGDVLQDTAEMAAHPDQAPALKAERANSADTVCGYMAQISPSDPLDAKQSAWKNQNCDGANLSPSSPLYVTGGM